MTEPILLDTNVLIRILNDDPQLSGTIRKAISQHSARIHLSVVNAWEITIKHRNGKLSFAVPLEDVLATILDGAVWPVLQVTPGHIRELAKLPPVHRDPFDRILVAQARAEGMILATSDAEMTRYGIRVIT